MTELVANTAGMATVFPAVVIGGPPHSGKSVLVYSLTQALRARGVAHYVLRACPDGEGDWANAAEQALVQTVRDKGAYSPAFVERMTRDVARRHLPLLVDVGGRPESWQEAVFGACTHAVLLVAEPDGQPAVYAEHLQDWEAMMARHGVPVVARLRSRLTGEGGVAAAGAGPLEGTLVGLERGETAAGPAFAALVDLLEEILRLPPALVQEVHLARAPAELALDVPRLARTLGAEGGRWEPEMLPALLDYLPAGKPLALYGRMPNFVAAALAVLALPAAVWLFDPRLGWVAPPGLALLEDPGAVEAQEGWSVAAEARGESVVVRMRTGSQHLAIEEPAGLPFPVVAAGGGVVLDGRVPLWLLAAAARTYGREAEWVAVYYVQAGAGIVVSSRGGRYGVGEVVGV